MADEIFDLESLVDLEQKFFDEGYKEGFEHGQEHGLTEGRELGIQKGFEIWEELGFYEGFAKVCKASFEKEGGDEKSARAAHTASALIELIEKFPQVNPTPKENQEESDEVDLIKLLNQIRSRYKMLCATIGAQPSLRSNSTTMPSSAAAASATLEVDDGLDEGHAVASGSASGEVKETNERKAVWAIDPGTMKNFEF